MAKEPSSGKDKGASSAGATAAASAEPTRGTPPDVVWDDSKMTTSFANVVNVSSTREEVTLFFGTNQTWNVSMRGQVKVQLSDRIILTPYAAKRLWLLLGGLIQEYENRHGVLDLSVAGGQRTS